jgi:hypothetical protein
MSTVYIRYFVKTTLVHYNVSVYVKGNETDVGGTVNGTLRSGMEEDDTLKSANSHPTYRQWHEY